MFNKYQNKIDSQTVQMQTPKEISEEMPEDSEEETEEDTNPGGETSVNIPFTGSPLYPRIYVGDSAKPLMNQFPNSEYVDDNISRTYTGLLTNFLG